MRIFVFLEKDLSELTGILKNSFENVNLKISFEKGNLIQQIDDFKPKIVIANFNKLDDLEYIQKISSNYFLITISDHITPEVVTKFKNAGVVDWVLTNYLDRLIIVIKSIKENLNKVSADKHHPKLSDGNSPLNLFYSIIDNLEEIAFVINKQGDIVYFNKLIKNTDALKGNKVYSYIFSEDLEKFKSVIEKGILTNVIYNSEIRLDIEGTLIFTEVFGHCIHNQNKEIVYIVLLFKNINDRKQIELNIKESEKLFRAVAETAIFSIFIYQEKFVYVNPAALQISGYSYDELMNMNFWDVVHPDFRELVKERGLKRLRGEDVPQRYEFKIQRKDNTERWVDFSASFVDYKGKPAALGIAFDITEKKIADELLKKSHYFYIKLFNEFPALLWRTDINGNVTFFNKTWLEFRGKTLEQEINNGWLKDIHPDDTNMVINDFKKYFDTRLSFNMEYRIKNNQNIYKWVYIQGCPFYDNEGNFSGFIGSGYDITDKKDYEEQISNLNSELQAKIKNLEEFKSVAIERELKMIELKEIIKNLMENKK